MTNNSAVNVTILYRTWQLASGLASLFFVTHYFTAEIQGYYFTFVSLLTIQTIFELGITYVITTITAQEMGDTSWKPTDASTPPSILAARLSALLHVIWRRALTVLIGFSFVATSLGIVVMRTDKSVQLHEWLIPWTLVVIFYGIKICITLFEGFLEGMHQVSRVARTRLLSSLAMSFALWTSITAGVNLYSLSIAAAVSVAISLLAYRGKIMTLAIYLYRLDQRTSKSKIWDMKTETFQSRIAFSWICGYVVFQTMVPIAFHFIGAAEAGRLGLALSLCSAVTAISSAWIGPKVPELSRLAACLKLNELKLRLHKMLMEVGLAAILLTIIIWIGFELAPFFSSNISARLPDRATLLTLLIATILNQYITVIATFSRSFKIDIFAWPTAFSACLSLIFGIYLTISIGATGTAMAYGLSLMLGLFPFSVYQHIMLKTSNLKFTGLKTS